MLQHDLTQKLCRDATKMIYMTLCIRCVTFARSPHLMAYDTYCGSGCACEDMRFKLDATMKSLNAKRIICYNNSTSFECNYLFDNPPEDLAGLERLFSDVVDVLSNKYETFEYACIMYGNGNSGISIKEIPSFNRNLYDL